MFNISVDAPANDLSKIGLNSNENVQDSIIEICLEVWMGLEHAIPDLQESSDDFDLTLKKPWVKNLYIIPKLFEKNILIFSPQAKLSFSHIPCLLLKNYLEVHSPPPDFLFFIHC